jgi:di/tricarboxylate transporter
MPLSFAASLGTAITIIGAPAFLIASGILQSVGRPGLSVFSIAPVGLMLSAVGTLFMLTLGRLLLPDRGRSEQAADRFRLTDYFTELTVLDDSPFVGKSVREVEGLEGEHQLVVTGWLRHGRMQRAPFGDAPIQRGDVLLVRASPDEILAIREHRRMELHPVTQYQSEAATGSESEAKEADDKLVQAIVAPDSDLIGRSLGELDFRRRYGAIVVGLWRRRGWLNQELAQVRLRAGDALVLMGDEQGLARVANDRGFLMLMPFQGEPRPKRRAPLAGAIMLASVLLASLSVVPLSVAMLSGAVAMVLSGCIRPRQAYRSIDTRIYVFIAGAIPLGEAMEQSGTSQVMASWLQSAVGGLPDALVLLIVFGIVAAITQFMSDAATVALFGPVAAALAHALGRSPEAFVVTVAMASVIAFLTPIGHHGNLLIYGPGRYQFNDFVRVGTPLTILLGVVTVFMVQVVWPS